MSMAEAYRELDAELNGLQAKACRVDELEAENAELRARIVRMATENAVLANERDEWRAKAYERRGW